MKQRIRFEDFLNPEMNEKEWQKPEKYQIYDHSGEMDEIDLEDCSTLLGSPEHTVYGKLIYSSGGNQELPKTEGGMCPPAVRDGTALAVSLELKVYGVVLDKSLINSEVENTLTTDCCFNPLSLDQIAQSKFNANATKSTSSGSGEVFFASTRKSLYSERENTLTNMSNAFRTSSYSLLDSLDFLQISSLCSSNSSMQKEGVANSNISKFNINFFVSDSFLKKENNTFVSTTNFIHTKPICFNLSNLPFFTSLPSSMHSSSVNLLFLSNSSSLSSSKSLVSLNFMNSSTPFANSDSSTLNRSGILITNSGIHITPNNINPPDINNFSLLRIENIYQKISDGKILVFLDENNKPVIIKKIEKVPYEVKIYDVTVPNHIIMVKREGKAVWSGNSQSLANSTTNSTNGTFVGTLSVDQDGGYNITATTYDKAGKSAVHTVIMVDTTKSNVTWISPPDPSEYTLGNTITLTCLVRDANTSAPIENYPVHFYNRTDGVTYDFGVNYTNSSGYAVMDWATTGVAEGWYYPKGNITDNATLLYHATAPYEANTSINLSYVKTLEIRNQAASQGITSINVLGSGGETITNPYNDVDGSGSAQNTSTTTPVVTIYNGVGNPTYKIWLKVDEGTDWDYIISDEKFNVTTDATEPGDVSTWTSLKPGGSWGTLVDSGKTVAPGNYKDLYLACLLKRSGTGNSTISVLGEVQ